MSEFKGTKGKWVINNTKYQILNENKNPLCDVWNFNKSQEEYEANAKLISCAPEMLDMLIEILDYLKSDNQAEAEEMLIYKTKELIKKATE